MDIGEALRLAQTALTAGRLNEAVEHLRIAVLLAPHGAPLWNELGATLARLGRGEDAADAFRQAITVQPAFKDAQYNLALTLFHLNRLDEAERVYRELLRLDANDAAAHFGLGTVAERRGRFDDARQSYESAIAAQPHFADAYINLGNVLWELGRHSDAHAALNRAIELNPGSAAAVRNLAVLFSKAGLVDREIEQYRKALVIDHNAPDAASLHSSLIHLMFYQLPYSPQAHFDEHVRWAKRFADPVTAAAKPHDNDRSPDRRLRIGYVSPDLRTNHPVVTFIEPILTHHDREHFEVYCYSNLANPDAGTERLRGKVDVWREIAALSDDDVAQQIRGDRIDILIDLAGHTGGNRLLVFARKSAPIQVSYLGYMATTGLRAIDWRITDVYADPPGETERFHTEQLFRIAPTFYCYQPPSSTIAPGIQSPRQVNGYVTFASSNRLVKVNNEVLVAWARILQAVERSRLWLLAPGSRDAAERCLAVFEKHGVARDRIELIPTRASEEYLRSLGQIDIGLDAFPVSGHTTTCNTLWMGTPVISLAGQTYVSRLGADVLASLDLHELIAHDVDEYVRIAIDLARDDARLAQLRHGLRALVEDRLSRGDQFTARLEAAYRTMWQQWCAGRAD